ncbi:alpha/beta fold hydrolase [Paroceanicella profunda]|nr:alpha/beta hydrolase [Paroceanicella profunda]
MPELTQNGIQQHYERQGGGPPLLLLAGMASDTASWAPLLPHLTGFELLMPDNRCAGRTRPLPCPISRRALLEDVLGLLDALGLERVHVAGHSLGGMLALDLAAAAPERVLSLTALSCARWVRPRALALFEALARLEPSSEPWFALLFQFLFSEGFHAKPGAVAAAAARAVGYAQLQPPEAFVAQAAVLPEFATPAPLTPLTCPALAMTGAEDIIAPPQVLDGFAALGFHTEAVEGAAHALHWEAPGAVARAIRACVARAG